MARKVTTLDAAVADEHLMGWTHWAYKYWDDPTTADTDQGLFTDDADLTSVKREKLRRLVDASVRINQMGYADRVSYISTGGGALLEYMEGKELPGVSVLER